MSYLNFIEIFFLKKDVTKKKKKREQREERGRGGLLEDLTLYMLALQQLHLCLMGIRQCHTLYMNSCEQWDFEESVNTSKHFQSKN